MAADPRDARDRARIILERCEQLARFSDEEERLTRAYGFPALRAAQDAVTGWMETAGMAVRRDAIGNLIGRYDEGGEATRRRGGKGSFELRASSFASSWPPGRLAAWPPFLIGGHLDTVRDAGRYDGILGVLTGLAVVERLHAAGQRLPFAVEVAAFADEEGLRFHTPYLGSWAFTGTLDPALLDRQDADGVTLREAILAFGGDPDGAIGRAPPGHYQGFIEAHIEQGPVLEAAGLPVSAVTAIAGQTRALVTITGEAGHAGTVPMGRRRDALAAAAAIILAVERVGRTTDGLMATVGRLMVDPGASNVIPADVRMTLDVRHADDAVRGAAVASLLEELATIARERGIGMAIANRHDIPAVACDPALTAALERAIADAGQPVQRLVSGAGHDAVALSAALPVTMLFVRCAGGVSHNPAESVTVEDVAVAVEVMDRLLLVQSSM